MNILLIRHGETDGNQKGFVQTADTPLNDVGREQATSLEERLSGRNISKILSSDFIRAKQTIEKFASRHNIPCQWSENLRERDFGELKGKFYKDINSTQVFKDDFAPPGGEDLEKFEKRVDFAWEQIISAGKPLSGELAIITHGLIIKDLLKRKLLVKDSLRKKYEIVPNTSITIFENKIPYKVLELANTKHLETLNLNKGIA